jgi:aldehyde dehydrogenase (NAD+)
VVKSPPQAPLDMYLVAEAAQAAGLPDGVLNVVAGGREAGVALVAHPGIDKVAFTGSTAAGRAIGEECGRALKPVTLELGGKSAAIVLDDADLGAVCRGLAFVAFAYAGQNCFTNSRLLAPRSRYEETVEAVSAFAAAIGVGDPLDPEVRMGPLISHDHRERVKALIASGIAEGARVTTGGRAPGHLPRGWYLEPTVFRDADNRMRICREEIFGPVLAIIPYDTDEQAIAIANDSDFGLAGSVWSSDAGRASSVARRIEAGTVGVNGFGFNSAAPFGGWKDSGVGTELGPEGLAAYALTQTIHLPA